MGLGFMWEGWGWELGKDKIGVVKVYFFYSDKYVFFIINTSDFLVPTS